MIRGWFSMASMVGVWRIVLLVAVLVWGEASIMLVGMEAARRAGGRGCCVCARLYWRGGFLGIRCVGSKDWRGFSLL